MLSTRTGASATNPESKDIWAASTGAALLLAALLASSGCQTRPYGPGTAVRTPAFSNNGSETLMMRPPPKPDIVIGMPNRPGQPTTVTTVITPTHQPAATSATPAYPPLPTTTSINEESLPPATAPATTEPSTIVPATKTPASTQPDATQKK